MRLAPLGAFRLRGKEVVFFEAARVRTPDLEHQKRTLYHSATPHLALKFKETMFSQVDIEKAASATFRKSGTSGTFSKTSIF